MIEITAGRDAVSAGARKEPIFNPALPASNIFGLKFHRDRKQGLLAFNVAGARSPSDVYVWSTAEGKNTIARWTTSETGGIPAKKFAEPELDPTKVMVTGGSYGGFMTLAVASNYADRIRCAVDIVGPSNFVTFLKNTESYRRDLRRVEYGDERDPKMAEFLERIAPLNNASKITKPLFVVHGANDPRGPQTEAAQIVATLKKQDT